MNYFLFKLQFDTAVHFGGSDSALSLYTSEETLRADTLFSALCHEALAQRGEAGLQQLCTEVQQGKLLFSDLMPWCGETFYLPKPISPSASTEEVETTLRKKVKKLAWIPVLRFDEYAKSLHAGHFDPEKKGTPEVRTSFGTHFEQTKADCRSRQPGPGTAASFGTHFEQTKAAVPAQGDTDPYQVGLFRFAPDCGLYFLCGCTDKGQENRLAALLDGLGLTGIGGRVSAGYGKFHRVSKIPLQTPSDAQAKWLKRVLTAEKMADQILLTTSLPQEAELEKALKDASFQLVRRGGFLASERVDTPQKKKTQYFLSAGSVLHRRYQGALYDVSLTEAHPVYRYSKPLFMGVKL